MQKRGCENCVLRLCVAVLVWEARLVTGLDNGLARLPPMGLSVFPANETYVKDQADLFVSKGLKNASYQYVILEDGWGNLTRSANGKLQANTTSFASGMATLSSYVHGLGLKIGLHAGAAALTCTGYPGSLDHEDQDARTFADWGIDYLQYDTCLSTGVNKSVQETYIAMSRALNRTGRRIMFSIASQGWEDPWSGWGLEYGNLWRTDADIIIPSWPEVVRVLDNSITLMANSLPSAIADMGLLQTASLGFKELKTQFALWSLMRSPLMFSMDLTSLSEEKLKLLTNNEAIAINQDSGLVPGDQVYKQGPYEIYAAPMKDGSRAVCIINRHVPGNNMSAKIQVLWRYIGYSDGVKANVRNVLDGISYGQFQKSFWSQVGPHEALLLRIVPLTRHRPMLVSPVTDLGLKDTIWKAWKTRVYNDVSEASALSNAESALIIIFSIIGGVLVLCVLISYAGSICNHFVKICHGLVFIFCCCGPCGLNRWAAPQGWYPPEPALPPQAPQALPTKPVRSTQMV